MRMINRKWIYTFAFMAVSIVAFAKGENIKVNVGFSGFYEPQTYFNSESGVYGNPAMLTADDKSSFSVNASLPFIVDNKFLKGEEGLGKTLGMNVDIDKQIRDQVKKQEDELRKDSGNADFKVTDVALFTPKTALSAGFMPALNGTTLIMKQKDFTVGVGYTKTSLKTDIMANDIGGSISADYNMGGTPTVIDAKISINSNTRFNVEYQKLSVGIGKETGVMGISVGAGIDYHSFYFDLNEKTNGKLKLAIDNKAAPEDVEFNYNNVIRNEINTPVYKLGATADWRIFKFGLGYNIYGESDVNRYSNSSKFNKDYQDIIKKQFPQYWDTNKDSIKPASIEISDFVKEANDIIGVAIENGIVEQYSRKFEGNSSIKLSGMVDLGVLMNCGFELERYSKPLWKFKIKDNDEQNDGYLFKNAFSMKEGDYELNSLMKIYAKVLFLKASVYAVGIDGKESMILPVNATLGSGFTLGDYDIALGMNAGSGIGITTQIKYNFK